MRESEFSIDRNSSSAACPHSQSPAADGQLKETGDPLNNDQDTYEFIFGVLNAVLTQRRLLEVQILVSWSIWVISTTASL